MKFQRRKVLLKASEAAGRGAAAGRRGVFSFLVLIAWVALLVALDGIGMVGWG